MLSMLPLKTKQGSHNALGGVVALSQAERSNFSLPAIADRFAGFDSSPRAIGML